MLCCALYLHWVEMDEVLGTGHAGGQEPQESRMPKGTRFSKTKYQDSEESGGYRKTVTAFLEWSQGERSHYRPVHTSTQQMVALGKQAVP